jgi:hypothetical protein
MSTAPIGAAFVALVGITAFGFSAFFVTTRGFDVSTCFRSPLVEDELRLEEVLEPLLLLLDALEWEPPLGLRLMLRLRRLLLLDVCFLGDLLDVASSFLLGMREHAASATFSGGLSIAFLRFNTTGTFAGTSELTSVAAEVADFFLRLLLVDFLPPGWSRLVSST